MLHVGCGLDARVYRLDPGAGVRWYDVDYPEVIGLRERVYPAGANYRMLSASVTDPSWLAEIPADRPVLFLGEGLTHVSDERRRAGAACAASSIDSGRANCSSTRSTRSGFVSQVINAVVRRSGSKLHWAHRRAELTSSMPFRRCVC